MSRNLWVSIVKQLVVILEENNIQYHIDASSSLYVHGVDFEMDDLDLTVEWGTFQKVLGLFVNYNPTEISTDYPPTFKFQMDDKIVHIMSYRSESGVGAAKDRVQVNFNGVIVWSKSISFYKKNMGPKHRLHGPLQKYLEGSKC